MVFEDVAVSTDSRHDQILNAAARLFATRGYPATSVGDIGDAVGLTGPALYRHFRRKQAVLDAVCLAGMQSLLEGAREIVASGNSPTKMFNDLVRLRVSFAFGQYKSAFLISRNEREHMSAPARQKLNKMSELYRAEWMRVLGNVRPTVNTAELQVAFAAAHVLMGYTPLDESTNDERDLQDHLFRMARAVMLA